MLHYNMICSAGHRHWTPTPKAFIGKTCGTRTCKEILVSYNDPADRYTRPKYVEGPRQREVKT